MSTFSADSLTVIVQPQYAITHINICVHMQEPKQWQPYRCLDMKKYSIHFKVKVVAQVAGNGKQVQNSRGKKQQVYCLLKEMNAEEMTAQDAAVGDGRLGVLPP